VTRRAFALVLSIVIGFAAFTAAVLTLFDRGVEGCRAVGACPALTPTPTAPPSFLVGTLTEVRLGAPRVPLAAVYDDRDLATPAESDWANGRGARRGQVLTYRVEFRGMGEAVCRVRWTLYDVATGERVPDGTGGFKTGRAQAWPDSQWTVVAAEEDANVGLLWVPYVAAGTFVVEIELLDSRGVPLDVERSEPFTVDQRDLPAG
jgi:hypothetical protein